MGVYAGLGLPTMQQSRGPTLVVQDKIQIVPWCALKIRFNLKYSLGFRVICGSSPARSGYDRYRSAPRPSSRWQIQHRVPAGDAHGTEIRPGTRPVGLFEQRAADRGGRLTGRTVVSGERNVRQQRTKRRNFTIAAVPVVLGDDNDCIPTMTGDPLRTLMDRAVDDIPQVGASFLEGPCAHVTIQSVRSFHNLPLSGRSCNANPRKRSVIPPP